MLFFNALWVGGLLAAFFQILFLVCKSISPKVTPLHILMTARMVGAILSRPSASLVRLLNSAGQGFSVMIICQYIHLGEYFQGIDNHRYQNVYQCVLRSRYS